MVPAKVKVYRKDKRQHFGESGCTGTKLPFPVVIIFNIGLRMESKQRYRFTM